GQIHGGVVQGLAQALYEDAVYDESGNLLTSTLTDYLVPSAVEAPDMVTDFTVTPSPHNPLGVKGIGEAGTIASTPAVANAVLDALAHLRVRHIDIPLRPEKILRALRKV
ncbi:MAG: molybdopterin cofactor-binding domain-containing protein, partial [Nitrososphaerota archaeon]